MSSSGERSNLRMTVILQSDLDSLASWSSTSHLKFNPSKCKVMHIGHKTNVLYHLKDELGEHWIDETTIERDLGIQVENNLKPSAHAVCEGGSES